MAFSAGDQVQLLSGGPIMVVDYAKSANRGMGMGMSAATAVDLCECVGFSAAGIPFRADFAATSLRAAPAVAPATPPPPPARSRSPWSTPPPATTGT